MSTFRERKIDAVSHLEDVEIIPKLSELDAFKNQRPAAMDGLNPLISGLYREDAYTIIDFVNNAPIGCITWEFDPTTGKLLHFGFFYRKIFRRIGKILYSLHKNRQFCGNIIDRMMVCQNSDVFHPYNGVRRPTDFAEGKKTDIRHFRWLLALVVKKFYPNDYEESCSPFFKLLFSEVFLHRDVLRHNFMFQYFHPVLYGNKHKFSFIHALKNFADHNKSIFYKHNGGLQNNAYGFQEWWTRIEDDKEETKETMLGSVYHYEETQAYAGRPNTLLTYIRNLQEHFMRGMETKNERIHNQNVLNRAENRWRKAFNDELEFQKRGHGSYSRLQNEAKMLPYLKDDTKLFNLPTYIEMEQRITEKFPGIYSSLMDIFLRSFTGIESVEFHCKLDAILVEEGSFAGKMYTNYATSSSSH